VCRAAALLVIAAARVAHADPDDVIARPLVLDAGQLDAQLTAEINVSSLLVGKPLSLAPDVWYGVTPALTIGVIHSDSSIDRLGPGASFCVNTQPILCPDRYHGSGLDALYLITSGSFAAAAHVRLLVRELHPFEPAVTGGATLRWQRGRWSISGDPYLQIGLDNLDRGNRAELWLPITLAVQPIQHVALELLTGWNSDLAIARDGYNVPGGIRVRARPTAHVDAGATFGFLSILGPQNDAKARVLFFDVGWHS